MIDKIKTFKKFGYYSKDLTLQSHKKVVAICNDCGKERIVNFYAYRDFCSSCGRRGERHPKYKGYPSKQSYFCIDCTNKISYWNFLYGNKRCMPCSKKDKLNSNYDNHKLAGKRNPMYKDGRTPLSILIRNMFEYKDWRIKCFQRDNFTCQECGQGGYLEVHHKKSFQNILNEFLNYYNQFSPIEDKETLVRLSINWKDFWNLDNGVTLCEECHKLTRIKI